MREFVPRQLQPLRTHHHHGDEPEQDADAKQNARNRVLDRGATGPGSNKECARDCAENRQDRRAPEVLVADLVLPQHKDRNIDNGEDAEKEECGRAAEGRHCAHKGMRPKARSDVKAIAMYGVRRLRCTRPRIGGSTPSRLMP